MMKHKILSHLVAALGIFLMVLPAQAADYVIDTKGSHAFIQFKISHLGYSWLLGRFNTFSGEFSFDEKNPDAARVAVDIDVTSVDSNHAERDKHLRGEKFLDVKKYPRAGFVSTSYKQLNNGKAELKGEFTLRGITRPLTIAVEQVGNGKDPWGGYRQGFQGTTSFALADFGITKDLGPSSKEVEIYLSIEGIRKK